MSFVRERSITVRFDIIKGAQVLQKGEKKKDVAAALRRCSLALRPRRGCIAPRSRMAWHKKQTHVGAGVDRGKVVVVIPV